MLELKVYENSKEIVLRFEHSLLSLSKWESKNKKPFLTRTPKTPEEMLDYYQAMLLDDADSTLVYRLSPEQLEQVDRFINEEFTASHVPTEKTGGSNEQVTSELIYYWMVALKIPFVAESWNLSRLMALIRIANFKQKPPEKQNTAAKLSEWEAANAARKAQFGSTG